MHLLLFKLQHIRRKKIVKLAFKGLFFYSIMAIILAGALSEAILSGKATILI